MEFGSFTSFLALMLVCEQRCYFANLNLLVFVILITIVVVSLKIPCLNLSTLTSLSVTQKFTFINQLVRYHRLATVRGSRS